MRAVVLEADIIPGADELLPILQRLGVKVAVLATGEHAAWLEGKPLRDFVHTVVVSESRSIDPVKRGLTQAMESLEALPHQTVVVSSRVLDIMTGKEGGVAKTVGVDVGNANPLALQAAGADHIITDMPSLLDVLE